MKSHSEGPAPLNLLALALGYCALFAAGCVIFRLTVEYIMPRL